MAADGEGGGRKGTTAAREDFCAGPVGICVGPVFERRRTTKSTKAGQHDRNTRWDIIRFGAKAKRQRVSEKTDSTRDARLARCTHPARFHKKPTGRPRHRQRLCTSRERCNFLGAERSTHPHNKRPGPMNEREKDDARAPCLPIADSPPASARGWPVACTPRAGRGRTRTA